LDPDTIADNNDDVVEIIHHSKGKSVALNEVNEDMDVTDNDDEENSLESRTSGTTLRKLPTSIVVYGHSVRCCWDLMNDMDTRDVLISLLD
jgi:hypothetical protein